MPPASADLLEVFESVSEGILVVDPTSRVTLANRAACDILGVAREDLVGRRCSEFLGAPVCALVVPPPDAAGARSPIRDRALRYVAADGTAKSLLVNTSPLQDAEGRPHGTVAVFRDVSLLEKLTEELHGKYRFHQLVGKSQAIQRVYRLV